MTTQARNQLLDNLITSFLGMEPDNRAFKEWQAVKDGMCDKDKEDIAAVIVETFIKTNAKAIKDGKLSLDEFEALMNEYEKHLTDSGKGFYEGRRRIAALLADEGIDSTQLLKTFDEKESDW